MWWAAGDHLGFLEEFNLLNKAAKKEERVQMSRASGYTAQGLAHAGHVLVVTELGGMPAAFTPIPFWPPSPADLDFPALFLRPVTSTPPPQAEHRRPSSAVQFPNPESWKPQRLCW